MAYTVLTSVSAGSTNTTSVTTGSIDTSGANLIVLAVASYSAAGSPTPSDSKSNTWTLFTVAATSTQSRATLWYSYAPTVGTGHTFTLDDGGTVQYPAIAAVAFSGSTSSPEDQENSSAQGTGQTIQPGSITPTQNDELVVSVCTTSANINTGSPPTNFTIPQSVTFASGQHWAIAIGYRIQTTAGAENPTWAVPSGGQSAATVSSFKVGTTATGNPWYAYAQQ